MRPSVEALDRGATLVPYVDAVYLAFPAIPRILDFFPSAAGGASNNPWRGAQILVISDPDFRGPILLRGSQIDVDLRLGFGVRQEPEWELFFPEGPWERAQNLEVEPARRATRELASPEVNYQD